VNPAAHHVIEEVATLSAALTRMAHFLRNSIQPSIGFRTSEMHPCWPCQILLPFAPLSLQWPSSLAPLDHFILDLSRDYNHPVQDLQKTRSPDKICTPSISNGTAKVNDLGSNAGILREAARAEDRPILFEHPRSVPMKAIYNRSAPFLTRAVAVMISPQAAQFMEPPVAI